MMSLALLLLLALRCFDGRGRHRCGVFVEGDFIDVVQGHQGKEETEKEDISSNTEVYIGKAWMDVYCKHKSQIIKCCCTIINGIIQKTIIIQDLLLNTSRCCRDIFSDKPEWVMFCFLWGFLGVCSGKSNKSSHPPA